MGREGRREKKVGTGYGIYCLGQWGLHLEGTAAPKEVLSMWSSRFPTSLPAQRLNHNSLGTDGDEQVLRDNPHPVDGETQKTDEPGRRQHPGKPFS